MNYAYTYFLNEYKLNRQTYVSDLNHVYGYISKYSALGVGLKIVWTEIVFNKWTKIGTIYNVVPVHPDEMGCALGTNLQNDFRRLSLRQHNVVVLY